MFFLISIAFSTHASILSDDYGVELFCENPYQTIPAIPGESTTFSVEITNIGSLHYTYDVPCTTDPPECTYYC
jgi:hypothetical protein